MVSSTKVEYEKRRGSPAVQARASEAAQPKATFINLELTQEEKTALTRFSATLEELDEFWQTFIASGYKITLKWDDYTNCYAAFAFPDDGSPNAYCILTGRGARPSRALRQLFFKHFVILETDWLGAASAPANRAEQEW